MAAAGGVAVGVGVLPPNKSVTPWPTELQPSSTKSSSTLTARSARARVICVLDKGAFISAYPEYAAFRYEVPPQKRLGRDKCVDK
jgi:hypothetical protein